MTTKKEITLSEINDKLNKLIAIMAIQNKNEDEQVKILSLLDYTIEEISMFTGISNRTVFRKRAKLK